MHPELPFFSDVRATPANAAGAGSRFGPSAHGRTPITPGLLVLKYDTLGTKLLKC